jgi:hypothetical protein
MAFGSSSQSSQSDEPHITLLKVAGTLGLSTALRTGNGALGVQVGKAATHAMESGVGVAEEYYEGQVDKQFSK